MKYITFVNGPISENAYIVFDEKSKEAAIIDPGFIEIEDVAKTIEESCLKLKYIINTHGHWDHIKNNEAIKRIFGGDILIHPEDEDFINNPDKMASFYFNDKIEPTKADAYLKEGYEVYLGDESLKVLHTPGHTMGSVILYNDQYAFTGDTLFYGSIGRCDLPGGNKEIMLESLEKIKENIPFKAIILPGHGLKETTFQEELETNPFLTGKMKPR